MSYFDQIRLQEFIGKPQNASFDGVPFTYVTHERENVGSQIVEHDVPGRVTNKLQVVGRKNTVYKVEGFLLGDDALTKKFALQERFLDSKTGILILPRTNGDIIYCKVSDGTSFHEDNREGYIAHFNAVFIVEDRKQRQVSLEAKVSPKVSAQTRIANYIESLTDKTNTFINSLSTGVENDAFEFYNYLRETIAQINTIIDGVIFTIANASRVIEQYKRIAETLLSYEKSKNLLLLTFGLERRLDELKNIALVNYFTSSLNQIFGNSNDVVQQKEEFITTYESILEDIPLEFCEEADAMAQNVITFYEEEILNLPSVVKVTFTDFKPFPIRVFERYGNLDRLDEMENINNLPDYNAVNEVFFLV